MASKKYTNPEDASFESDLRALFDEQKRQAQPSQALLQRLHELPEEPSMAWFWRLWWMPVPAAALSLLLAFFWKPAVVPVPVLQAKGGVWQILFARQEPGTPKGMLAQELKSGGQLNPGDLVQFVYEVPPYTHVMIVGLNQEGKVYPMVVERGGASLLLRKKKGILPQRRGSARAFRLDQYIGPERFFIAMAEQPFSYRALERAIRTQWKQAPSVKRCNRARGPWAIWSIMFRKVPKQKR